MSTYRSRIPAVNLGACPVLKCRMSYKFFFLNCVKVNWPLISAKYGLL